jgi:two-component system, NtrC family, sensor kinase
MSLDVAPNVHNQSQRRAATTPGVPVRSMDKDFQIRFNAGLLILMTVAAITFAGINFQKERELQTPSDGIRWAESNSGLRVDRIEANGPGAKAGIKAGDQLTAINQHDVKSTATQVGELYRAGVWSKATYSLIRESVPVDAVVILVPVDKSVNQWKRFIALIYLCIGLYVLLRRWTAPGSTHFYIFCLVSFIFYAFSFTGKLNEFDWTIFWGNEVAWLLQPALFLHFVLVFPEKRNFIRKHRWVVPAIYVPSVLLLVMYVFSLTFLKANGNLSWDLDRLQMGYLALYFIVAAGALWYCYRQASTPILRQQWPCRYCRWRCCL